MEAGDTPVNISHPDHLRWKFDKVDLILSPTTPTTAFKIGEKTDDPLSMYLNDIFTVPVNLAGLPGISIPAGIDKNKYPLGTTLAVGLGFFFVFKISGI